MEQPYRRVVVPVGGTSSEFLAQEQAIALAAPLRVPVVGVHVGKRGIGHAQDLWKYLDDAGSRFSVPVEHLELEGDTGEELVNELDATDLVVIGSHRNGRRRYLGSVAQYLCRHAPGPVMVVRLNGG